MEGLLTKTNVLTPKTRNSTAIAGYTITAIAKRPSTLTTEVGWAVVRVNDTTGDTDWAKYNGVATDEYVFTAVNIHELTFSE